MKTCTHCHQLLPFTAFHKQLNRHASRCKDCRREVKGSTKRPQTIQEAFWKYVTPGKPNECWEWTGCCFTSGYSEIAFQYRVLRAHRISYEMHKGGITANLYVCHTCDNPPCVNPAHLFLGTAQDNATDSKLKGRKKQIGKNRKGKKLTIAQVREIRLLAYNTSTAKLAKRFMVSLPTIYDIWQERCWPDII